MSIENVDHVSQPSAEMKKDRWKTLRDGTGKGIETLRSRSSGHGGQNVNKVETKVTVRLNVNEYPDLSDEERERIRFALAGQISRDGWVSVSAQDTRSQGQNESLAIERLIQKIEIALFVPIERYKPKEPASIRAQKAKGAKERLKEKNVRKETKEARKKIKRDTE